MMSQNGLWPIVLYCPVCATGDSPAVARVALVASHAPRAFPVHYCETHPEQRLWGIRASTSLTCRNIPEAAP